MNVKGSKRDFYCPTTLSIATCSGAVGWKKEMSFVQGSRVPVLLENIACAVFTFACHIAVIEKSHTTEIISSNFGITHEVMNVITSFDWEQRLEDVTNG